MFTLNNKDDKIDVNVPIADMEDKLEEEEEEEIPDFFLCCICLDLLHKPIILACGHMSCFWCVHKSMNGARESSCPICRHPYLHFPSICQILHFFIIKMYPIAYKRRENQIIEEEKRQDTFSPQFDSHSWNPHPIAKANFAGSSQAVMVHDLNHGSSRNSSLLAECGHSESVSNLQSTSSKSSDQDLEQRFNECTVAPDQKNALLRKSNENCRTVMISDLLCSACKELLFHPVALNCGHVYCESCLPHRENGKLKCLECQVLHPGEVPKVCLDLDHFVEEQLPEEYKLRKSAVQPRESVSENIKNETGPNKNDKQRSHLPWFTAPGKGVQGVHPGVGCDYCGIYPIIGDRYQCKDCVEKIGFDLCGDCYNSRSKLPGRFNQQHKPEHRFELFKQDFMHCFMKRLVSGQLVTGPWVYFRPDNGSASGFEVDPEYQEFLLTHAEILDDTQGSSEMDQEYQEFLLTHAENLEDTQGSSGLEHQEDPEFLLTPAQESSERPNRSFPGVDPSHEHDPPSS